uniref:Transcriptional regulator n=1 Tax=Globodera pallida TaxID=36090 RepID=A0A183CNT6_GLOPA
MNANNFSPALALNAKFAIDGLRFLREISAIIGEQRQQKLAQQNEGGESVRFEIGLTRAVQLISWPHYGRPVLPQRLRTLEPNLAVTSNSPANLHWLTH